MPTHKKRTINPSGFSYIDKYIGKRRVFIPKPDESVVSFQPLEGPESENRFRLDIELNKSPFSLLKKLNVPRRIAVFELKVETTSLDVAEFEGFPDDVANSIPAFEDEEGLTRYFVPDEITVQFKDGIADEQAEAIVADLGSEILKRQRTVGYYTVSVPEGSSLFEAIDVFSARDEVFFSEASEISFDDRMNIPTDLEIADLWGLHNTGQLVQGIRGTPGVDISARQAWETTTGDSRVVISVIDTGMDLNHPDLEPNLLDRNGEDWDFADDDGIPEDGAGHGTHVCGICAATFENGRGIVGVAPSCRLMPLRINLDGGMNQNRADAINFVAKKSREAAGNRKFVMNCSWGSSGNYTAILVAVLNARRDGVVSIFAAGNSNRDMDILPQYPAAYPHVIGVGALNSNNEKSESSNYGSQIDISAPGVNILSTVPSGAYDFKSGTSMAAPHVAGVAALVWSANFALTNQDVREILEGNCEMVDGENPHFVGKLGKGRVNAHRALQAASAAVPSLDALT